ncbi:AT-hook motif nuclear-localized protein 17-like [Cornus florida]|uniref:AT-hook motif nuclear-localized protein 17-like n=1 Tax=Cornus florida TaxID=4283 RepID=UPI0028970AC6|nr:AT-hook motif nuclear-localized protein 17-like [Cornus florida]
MKGECVEEKDHPNNMFTKLNQTHNFHHHNHFQLTQTSEEDDSRSPGGAITPTVRGGDGATIEVVRRARGRPPGSKNKPKPPIIITRDTEPSMSPHVLEVAGGVDVVDAVSRFCRKRNMGLCVLTGSGTVANVTLKQPSTTPGATVTFHGRFDILSLSATVLPNTTSLDLLPVANGFTISLAGPQGQIVGGSVVGSLLAAGTVYVVAASFNNPSFHRLPAEDDVRSSASGGNVNGRGQSSPGDSGGGDGGHPPAAAESCGMSVYSSHLPSDVIWAPSARQPQPLPPY